MRVLLILPLTSLNRHFESTVLMLADAGHQVVIATPGKRNDWPLAERITNHANISRAVCPEQRGDEWNESATDFRFIADCARYFEKPFLHADKLRARALQTFVKALTNEQKSHVVCRCPACAERIVDADVAKLRPKLGDAGAARLKRLLRLIEQAIPSDPAREAFLEAQRPDVVLVSPLVGLGSEQADWVKSAQALGIPVGFPVFSWDNLTTKGLVHVAPDRMFVWNDIQVDEAVRLHGYPADRVVVTGAPRFDAFFRLKPSKTREKFCDKLGLDPSMPIVTYLCSSEFVAGHEVKFVGRWIEEIRQSPELAACGVLIRPHPRSLEQWQGVDVKRWGNVGLQISKVLNADQSLYNTLYHSAAVVGLNTSAQIEAGILGKPVYTILAPGFERGQQGTLHFRYLLREEGGFVEVAQDFDEHRRQLADGVMGRFDPAVIRNFIQRFIRPAGWDVEATPLLADAIVKMAPRASGSRVRKWLRSVARDAKRLDSRR